MEFASEKVRMEVLTKPHHWDVAISPNPFLVEGLTHKEIEVLNKKVFIVLKATKRMLAGMVKGTLKYPDGDNWTLYEWFRFMREEAEDQVNYLNLMESVVEEASSSNS